MFETPMMPYAHPHSAERRRSSVLSLSGFDNLFGDIESHDNFMPHDMPHFDASYSYEPTAAFDFTKQAMTFMPQHDAFGRRASVSMFQVPSLSQSILESKESDAPMVHPSTPANYMTLGRQDMSPRKERSGSTLSSKVPDGRKRKTAKKFGKVISTIKSNRAKPAQTFFCAEVPKKESRVKGAVYQIGEERKKWDGRQWRRLCVVQDCCSAARGATDFCIVHGRGSLTKTVIDNEEVEVLLCVKDNEDQSGFSSSSDSEGRGKLSNKRKSEDFSDQSLSKAMKVIAISSPRSSSLGMPDVATESTTKRCGYLTAMGDPCGNVIHQNDPNKYCYTCRTYLSTSY